MFHVAVQDFAKRMLETQAVKLGNIGDDTYYIIDGKVWRISDSVVYRSDDSLESTTLQRLCRTI